MVIRFSKQADKDLQNIQDFIRKDSYYNSMLVIEKILVKINTLLKYPEIGRVILKTNNAVLWQILVYKYRIIYKIDGDFVEIVTLHHSARLLDDNPGISQYFDEI